MLSWNHIPVGSGTMRVVSTRITAHTMTPLSTIRLSGLTFVNELSTDDAERAALLLTIHDRFYALQAVSAVFKYIENKFSTIYPPHTLVIKYRPIEGA